MRQAINEKMTKDDLDYIFDLQKLISEKNKNGNPQVLDNKVTQLFKALHGLLQIYNV